VFVPVHDRRRPCGRSPTRTRVLDAGADKVSINSAALARPELIGELAQVFGAQCVVLAIDAKKRPDGSYEAYVAGGPHTDRPATRSPGAREGRRARGRGRSCSRAWTTDGVGTGYELELTRAVSKRRRGPRDRVRRGGRAAAT